MEADEEQKIVIRPKFVAILCAIIIIPFLLHALSGFSGLVSAFSALVFLPWVLFKCLTTSEPNYWDVIPETTARVIWVATLSIGCGLYFLVDPQMATGWFITAAFSFLHEPTARYVLFMLGMSVP